MFFIPFAFLLLRVRMPHSHYPLHTAISPILITFLAKFSSSKMSHQRHTDSRPTHPHSISTQICCALFVANLIAILFVFAPINMYLSQRSQLNFCEHRIRTVHLTIANGFIALYARKSADENIADDDYANLPIHLVNGTFRIQCGACALIYLSCC